MTVTNLILYMNYLIFISSAIIFSSIYTYLCYFTCSCHGITYLRSVSKPELETHVLQCSLEPFKKSAPTKTIELIDPKTIHLKNIFLVEIIISDQLVVHFWYCQEQSSTFGPFR